MFAVKNSEKAAEIAEALKAKGINANKKGQNGVANWHVYKNWKHILGRKGNNDSGFSFTLSEMIYSEDMCPELLTLLAEPFR
jgi:hypothetical protein